MRRFVFTLAVVAASRDVRASPTRFAALATGGFWITGHNYGEKQGGAEVDIEHDVADIYRLGVGTSLNEYKLDDDECFGSSGQLGEIFVAAGLHEPSERTVHLFVEARIGVRAARMVPSCYGGKPVGYDAFLVERLVAGVDIGEGKARVRVQLGVGLSSESRDPIEIAFGLGASF
jgi:hypothetical protein